MFSAAIPCSGPVRLLLSRQVFQVLRAFFADSCIPPPLFTGIYRAHFGGGHLPMPDAQTPNGTRVIWFVRSPEMHVVPPRGGRRQFRSVRHLYGVPLRSPTTSRCRPAAPSKEKSPCV